MATNNIDGITGDIEICKTWENHYTTLFNSVPETPFDYEKIKEQSADECKYFTCDEVLKAIESLNAGKSPDRSGITAEHLQYADNTIHVILTMCINAMLKHAYLPNDFMQSVITPVLKNTNCNITDKGNYRSITIATTISKVFEKIILKRISEYLATTKNQFGFKKNHS